MSRHKLRALDYIEHMLEACTKIQQYTTGKTEADFLAESLLQDSVVRNLEIIGEASRQLRDVLPDAPSRFPALPFSTMYAMRNLLIHGYIFVNYRVIWNVVAQEILPLRANLESALANWPPDLS